MLTTHTSSHSPERPKSSKRSRHSLPPLKFSSSCPHLPLHPSGKTSPAAVTSAVAFGSTISPGPSSRRTVETKDNISVRSLDSKRMVSEFPWEERAASGSTSPAVELAETLVRIPRPTTPPPLSHSKSDPVAGVRGSRTSARSSLRLELPSPLLTDGFGNRVGDQQHRVFGSGVTGDRQSGRFTGQPLLGTAYPTTPDIGLNNMTATRGVWDDEGPRDTAAAGEAIGRSGAATAAQHVLLAAGSHLGRGGLAVLTPPDDSGILEWSSDAMLSEAVYSKREASGADIELTQTNNLSEDLPKKVPNEADEDRAPQGTGTNEKEPANSDIEQKAESDHPQRTDDPGREGLIDDDWVGNAMEVLMGSNLPISTATEAVRILSYTLPCPLPSTPADFDTSRTTKLPASAAAAPLVAAAAGQQLSPTIAAKCASKADEISGELGEEDVHTEDGITTALHSLTGAIQRHYSQQGSSRVYIHVSHAINPHVPLNRLPSTPPPSTGGLSTGSTPASESGSGGYFSPMVFNSIVVASSSMSTPTGGTNPPAHPPMSLPSPNPILPPSSLHLTLLERYIPPSSHEEDIAMFSPKSSILLDRLFELSPHGGSLLFVYPTKVGARNFERDYLGPVLDPLLRKLMVLYALREELLWGIGNMAGSKKMADYPVLRLRVENFCNALSAGQGDLPPTSVRLIYAAKATVPLDELSWREWWTQQEHARVRDLVKSHFANQTQSSGKASQANTTSSASSGYGAPGDLAREVLDGVRAPAVRPSSRGMGEAVLASSMSGTGGGGLGGAGVIGAGGVIKGKQSGSQSRRGPPSRRRVEVGVFILRRGLDS